MRDNDDLHDIPPMVPSRDEVVTRQHTRKTPDIVKPNLYGEKVTVSTWPVRVMLTLLTVGLLAVGYGAYTFHGSYVQEVQQAERRIADLENRLALVGDSAEETTANVLERLDFNFSEIDKLWAARRTLMQSIEDLTGRVAVAEDGIKESIDGLEVARADLETTNQRIVQSTNLLEDTRRDIGGMENTVAQSSQSIATLTTAVQNLQSVSQEMMNLRATMVQAQGASGGVNDRLMKVEEAIEAIDAFRLQINQALLRLQQNIEAVSAAQ